MKPLKLPTEFTKLKKSKKNWWKFDESIYTIYPFNFYKQNQRRGIWNQKENKSELKETYKNILNLFFLYDTLLSSATL